MVKGQPCRSYLSTRVINLLTWTGKGMVTTWFRILKSTVSYIQIEFIIIIILLSVEYKSCIATLKTILKWWQYFPIISYSFITFEIIIIIYPLLEWISEPTKIYLHDYSIIISFNNIYEVGINTPQVSGNNPLFSMWFTWYKGTYSG